MSAEIIPFSAFKKPSAAPSYIALMAFLDHLYGSPIALASEREKDTPGNRRFYAHTAYCAILNNLSRPITPEADRLFHDLFAVDYSKYLRYLLRARAPKNAPALYASFHAAMETPQGRLMEAIRADFQPAHFGPQPVRRLNDIDSLPGLEWLESRDDSAPCRGLLVCAYTKREAALDETCRHLHRLNDLIPRLNEGIPPEETMISWHSLSDSGRQHNGLFRLIAPEGASPGARSPSAPRP